MTSMIWRLYLCCMNEENKENGSTGSPRQDSGQASQAESQTSELDKLKAERDEYLNGWKRAKADLINYQKEEVRRTEEMAKFGNESILREVLRVVDNFSLALSALGKKGETDIGLKMIRSQIDDLLKRNGVELIKVLPGDELNPGIHEAIALVEPTGEMKPGTIAEEVEPGYLIYGKVLRPVKVKVVK